MADRVKITFRLDAEDHARLEAELTRTQEGLNVFLVRAVRAVLEGCQHPASTPCQHPPASTGSTLVNTDLLPASTPLDAEAEAALIEREQSRLEALRADRGVAPRSTPAGIGPAPGALPRGSRCATCRKPGNRYFEGVLYCFEHALAAEDAHRKAHGVDPGERPRLPGRVALPLCEACRSRRYQIESVGGWAVAKRCPDCLRPCPQPGCSKGYLHYEWAERSYTADCYCRQRETGIALFNAARVPGRYAGLLVGPLAPPKGYRRTASQTVAAETCEEWARQYQPRARGLLLWGPVGISKTTHLARALAFVTLGHKVAGAFAEWGILLEQIKETFDTEEENPLTPLLSVPVLVLDELGKRPLASEWQASQLDALISARYQAGHTTLYSSNLEPDALRERISYRLYDRLIETSEILEVQGHSVRPALAAEEAAHAH